MYIGEIIKKYRDENKLSQRAIARRASLSPSYINTLEKIYNPKTGKPYSITTDAAQDLAKAMLMPIQDLLDLIDDNQEFRITSSNSIRIPVLGYVAAGIPMEAIENIVDYEEIDEELAKKGDMFGLIIKGDSMFPYILNDDVLIVKKQDNCESGDIAVVRVNGDEVTVKKIHKHEDGSITLIPFNPVYQQVTYTVEQIEKLPIKIVGIFAELRRKKFN